MAAKDTNEDRKQDDQDGDVMLDMSQTAVKKMIAEAKERGYITYDQLNDVLPPEQVSSEQIEDVMSMLSEMGINVIEDDEPDEDEAGKKGGELVETSSSREVTVSHTEGEKLDRTDDPVRMYLREMGSVELLSREGEIAIAKRIEAGRNTMIAGLCESPLTFQAITIWRDELLSEDILLRDVIDLETTFGRSMGEDGDVEAPVVDAAAPEAKSRRSDEPELDADGNPIVKEDDDDDDEQANMSLAAMEAALKPRVLETLDRIGERLCTAVRDAGHAHVGDAQRGRQFLGGRGVALPDAAVGDRRARQRAASPQQPDRGADRPALRHQPPDHGDRQRDGEARRPGADQPQGIRGRIPRLRARPDLARPDG